MGDYKAIQPQHELYGLYQGQYAKSLSGDTGNAGANILQQLALRMRADREGNSYNQALDQAQRSQLQGQGIMERGETGRKYLAEIKNLRDAGVLGATTVNPDGTVSVDQTRADQSDAIALNDQNAGAFQKKGTTLAAMGQAGILPPPEQIGPIMASPLDPSANTYLPYVPPAVGQRAEAAANSQPAKNETAAANTTKAQAAVIAANAQAEKAHKYLPGGAGKGKSSGGSDKVKVNPSVFGGTQSLVTTDQAKADAFQAQHGNLFGGPAPASNGAATLQAQASELGRRHTSRPTVMVAGQPVPNPWYKAK